MLSKTNLITLFICVVCAFCGSVAFAQTPGYILIGDSIYTEGYISFNPLRPDQVEYLQIKNAEPKLYTADQLSEFGYKDSTKYKSEMVPYEGKSQKLFLRLLAAGKTKLYMLPSGDAFYIKKEDFTLLTKDNLQAALQPYTENCPDFEWQLKRVKLSERSLTYFGNIINKGKCNAIPFNSYGFVTAANHSVIQLSEDAFSDNTYGAFKMTSENASVGIFAETPAWVVSNLNFAGQLTYNKMRFSQAYSQTIHDQDIQLNMDLLRFNIQPKYYLHVRRFGFFAEAGPELLYVFNQSGKLLQATRIHDGKGNTKVQLRFTDNFLETQPIQVAITGGTGLAFYYAATHYVSLSINASHTFNKDQAINNFSTTLRLNL